MFEVLNHDTSYQREDYIYHCVTLAQIRSRMERSKNFPHVKILNFHTGEIVPIDERVACQHCAYYGGASDCNVAA